MGRVELAVDGEVTGLGGGDLHEQALAGLHRLLDVQGVDAEAVHLVGGVADDEDGLVALAYVDRPALPARRRADLGRRDGTVHGAYAARDRQKRDDSNDDEECPLHGRAT